MLFINECIAIPLICKWTFILSIFYRKTKSHPICFNLYNHKFKDFYFLIREFEVKKSLAEIEN